MKTILINDLPSTYSIDNTGVSDSQSTLQAAVNSLGAVGGKITIPPGTYFVGSPVYITSQIVISGHSRFSTTLTTNGNDNVILMLQTGNNYMSVRDMTLLGPDSGSPVHSPLAIQSPVVGFTVENVNSWGGAWGVFDSGGVDGVFINVFPSGIQGGLLSINGANKYQSCKFDSGAITGQQHAIYMQSTPNSGVIENEFSQCDFSGPFTGSGVIFNDTSNPAQSIARFVACTFGSVINVASAQSVMFVGCEMPTEGGFNVRSGVGCAVVGCYALSGPTNYPSNIAKSGNINIW